MFVLVLGSTTTTTPPHIQPQPHGTAGANATLAGTGSIVVPSLVPLLVPLLPTSLALQHTSCRSASPQPANDTLSDRVTIVTVRHPGSVLAACSASFRQHPPVSMCDGIPPSRLGHMPPFYTSEMSGGTRTGVGGGLEERAPSTILNRRQRRHSSDDMFVCIF